MHKGENMNFNKQKQIGRLYMLNKRFFIFAQFNVYYMKNKNRKQDTATRIKNTTLLNSSFAKKKYMVVVLAVIIPRNLIKSAFVFLEYPSLFIHSSSSSLFSNGFR